MILLVCFFVFFIGCEEKKPDPPKFKVGDMVKMVNGGTQGQIIGVNYQSYSSYYDGQFYEMKGWQYAVRLNIKNIVTDSKVLSDDGPVKFESYIEKTIWEFELEKMEEINDSNKTKSCR